MDIHKDLKALGSGHTDYAYDSADAGLLERFANPMPKFVRKANVPLWTGTATVKIMSPEFTSLCPMTGQPDFATIVIEYRPKDWCVESKSIKLYLGSFRQAREFHESCVTKIFNDLKKLLEPDALMVEGQFTPRGGIPFWPKIVWSK